MMRIVLMAVRTLAMFMFVSCVSLGAGNNGNVIEYERDMAFKNRIISKTVFVVTKCEQDVTSSNLLDLLKINDSVTFSGTGVILRSGPSGSYILTAHHVVTQKGYSCVSSIYRSSDKKHLFPVVSNVLVSSKQDDISLMAVHVDLGINTDIASRSYLGQKLTVAGYPSIGVLAEGTDKNSRSISINSGEYATEIYDKDGDLFVFRMTCDVFSGYSGGGVFDVSGNLVGITSFMLAVPVVYGGSVFLVPRPGYYFARPYNKIRKMLVAAGYTNILT